VTKVVDCLN